MYHSDFPEKLCSDSFRLHTSGHGAMLKSRPVHQTDYYDISRNLLRIQIVSQLHGCLNTYIFRITVTGSYRTCTGFSINPCGTYNDWFKTNKCYLIFAISVYADFLLFVQYVLLPKHIVSKNIQYSALSRLFAFLCYYSTAFFTIFQISAFYLTAHFVFIVISDCLLFFNNQ